MKKIETNEQMQNFFLLMKVILNVHKNISEGGKREEKHCNPLSDVQVQR